MLESTPSGGNEIRMENGITARSSVRLRVIRFGPFEFQPDTGELRKHGLRVKLRGQPIEVLTMLLQHPGEPVTREELQRRLWPADTYVDFEHGLNAAMKRLRAALGDSADAPRFIETLAGRGYRFIAPVSQPAEEAPQIPPPPVADAKPEPEPEAKPAARRRPVLWIGAAAGFVLLILLAMNFARLRDMVRGRTSPGPIRSLVVLPLANLSGDPDAGLLRGGYDRCTPPTPGRHRLSARHLPNFFDALSGQRQTASGHRTGVERRRGCRRLRIAIGRPRADQRGTHSRRHGPPPVEQQLRKRFARRVCPAGGGGPANRRGDSGHLDAA